MKTRIALFIAALALPCAGVAQAQKPAAAKVPEKLQESHGSK